MKSFAMISALLTILVAHSLATDEKWTSKTGILEDVDLSQMLEDLQPTITEKIVKSGYFVEYSAAIKLLQLQITPMKDQNFSTNSEKKELKRAILDEINLSEILQSLTPTVKETITVDGYNVFFVAKVKLQKLQVVPVINQSSTQSPTNSGILTTTAAEISTSEAPADTKTTEQPVTTIPETEAPSTPRPTFATMTSVDEMNLWSRCQGVSVDGIQRMMSKFGPDAIVKAVNSNQWTCLHYAASRGHLNIVSLLIENGADVEAVDKWQQTCLHRAAVNGHPNIIALLVENGADLDPKDDDGETPLRWAIKRRNYSSITTLIKLGADLEKAKESNYDQTRFNISMSQEKTKDAIKEGQRLAGQTQRFDGLSTFEWKDLRSKKIVTCFY